MTNREGGGILDVINFYLLLFFTLLHMKKTFIKAKKIFNHIKKHKQHAVITMIALFAGLFWALVLIGNHQASANFDISFCTTVTDVPQAECEALVNLYHTTHGASWTTRTNWWTSTTVWNWHGITLSGGHVTHINLWWNNLVWTLPSISGLNSLVELYVNNNSLTSISFLVGLPSLTHLGIYHNQLTSLPSFTGLSSITYLILHNNQLTTLPESLQLSTTLWGNYWLHLHHNKICSRSWSAGLIAFVQAKTAWYGWQSTQDTSACHLRCTGVWTWWSNVSLCIDPLGDGYCEYGGSLNLGITWYSAASREIGSWFQTISGNNAWFCNDLQGKAPRTLNIQSSDILNVTTNLSGQTISSGNVAIKNPAATFVQWVCTANAWSSTGNRIPINISTVILGKSSGTGEVCKVQTSQLDLQVTIPAFQALGSYSGTLTITIPNL